MRETVLVKAQSPEGEIYLLKNPETGLWEKAVLEPKPAEKTVPRHHESKPIKKAVVQEKKPVETEDNLSWLFKMLDEKIEFEDPSLEAARRGEYPPKKMKKPPTVKEKLNSLVIDILKRQVSPSKMVERTKWLVYESLGVHDVSESNRQGRD